MGIAELESAWNEQADEFNQWGALSLGEIVAFTQQVEREACANILNLSRADALLMCGEMTAQEWRTVSAVLRALQSRMRANSGDPRLVKYASVRTNF